MSDRVLITGAEGFVGRHLVAELGARAIPAELDVTDSASLLAAVRASSLSAVVHLAAVSSVARSWAEAAEVWRVNVLGTVNLLTAVRAEAPGARVVLASTGEVYGRANRIPTPESTPLSPLSPYAASKAAAEIACAQAARADGLDVVIVRAFPHIGPGQDEQFAVGSWVRQIASIEATGRGVLRVGNLTVGRDFTDVRDACAAYRLLVNREVPTGTYNLASGEVVSLRDVVDTLRTLAQSQVEVEQDPSLLRRVDIEVLAGDSSALRAVTGWQPRIPLEASLADALDEVRARGKADMK